MLEKPALDGDLLFHLYTDRERKKTHRAFLMRIVIMSQGLVILDILVTDYFPHLGRLNQLLGLSQQLDNDVKHLGKHKYIAHQLAVVYVS